MIPGQPGQPPPVYSPQVFGPTMGALGIGAPSWGATQHMSASQMQGSLGFAGGATNFLGTTALPVGFLGAEALSMFSPVMRNMSSLPMQAAGHLLRPFDFMGNAFMGMGAAGGKAGLRAGQFLGQGGRLGMALGGAGMVGGAIAGALPPALAMMAMSEGVIQTGQSFFEGASENLAGRALMQSMAPTVLPGQGISRGEASRVGQDLSRLSDDMGIDMKQMSGLMKQMGNMGMFQTVSNLREFRSKYKEILGTVKEVAQTLQTTLDDALQTFGELKTQGFYTSADITAAAARDKARGAAGGITAGRLGMAGQMGAQASRAYGMYGRHGAEVGKTALTAVQAAVRSGAVSEEMIMEMGGVDAAAAGLARQQMAFLGSARGTAMIAAAGGSPSSVLGTGHTVESLVERAANTGIGGIMHARSRQAKEAFAPYAGMAMISMAASQANQLGQDSPYGIIGMLGTMGLSEDQAKLLVRSTMEMPRVMQREAAEQYNQQLRSDWDRLRSETKATARLERWSDNFGLFRAARFAGRGAADTLGREYENAINYFTGRGGESPITEDDLVLGREGLSGLGDVSRLNRRGFGEGFFGVPSVGDRIRKEISSDVLRSGGGRDFIEGYRNASQNLVELTAEQKLNLYNLAKRDKFDLGNVDLIRAWTKAGGEGAGKDVRLWAAGKRVGLFDQDMSYQEWRKQDSKFKGHVRGMLQKGLAEMGDEFVERGEYLLGDIGLASGTVTSYDEARRQLEGATGRFLEKVDKAMVGDSLLGFGSIGWGSLGTFEKRGLKELITGKGALPFKEYIEAIGSQDPEKILQARKKLEGLADQDALEALDRISERAEKDSKFRNQLRTAFHHEGVGRGMELQSAAKLIDVTAKRDVAQSAHLLRQMRKGDLSRIPEQMRGQKNLEDLIENFQTTSESGSYRGRQAALEGLYRHLGRDGFQDYERQLLIEMTGAGSGTGQVVDRIEALAGANRDDAKTLLGDLGLEEGQIDSALGGMGSGKLGTDNAIKLLSRLNALEHAIEGGKEGMVAGAAGEAAYVEANTRFVDAVDRFASRVNLATPWVDLLTSELAETGGAVTGQSN